jgi:hypothetical protein
VTSSEDSAPPGSPPGPRPATDVEADEAIGALVAAIISLPWIPFLWWVTGLTAVWLGHRIRATVPPSPLTARTRRIAGVGFWLGLVSLLVKVKLLILGPS